MSPPVNASTVVKEPGWVVSRGDRGQLGQRDLAAGAVECHDHDIGPADAGQGGGHQGAAAIGLERRVVILARGTRDAGQGSDIEFAAGAVAAKEHRAAADLVQHRQLDIPAVESFHLVKEPAWVVSVVIVVSAGSESRLPVPMLRGTSRRRRLRCNWSGPRE